MRIDGLFQGQAANLSNASDIISRLNPGDVVRAQVLEIMSNEVLLKLFDGTTLRASTMTNLEAGKGEFANFIVKNKMENQIFLEQAKSNMFKSETLEGFLQKQLATLGLEANEQNIEIAEKMNTNFIPFKKETFDDVLNIIGKFKDLGAAKAVFMASNQITTSEKNMEALKQLVDAKMQTGSEIENLMKLLNEVKNSSTAGRETALVQTKTDPNTIKLLIENELNANQNPDLIKVVKGFDLKGKIQEFMENAIKFPDNDPDVELGQFIKNIPAMLRPRERGAITDFISSLVTRLKESNQSKAPEFSMVNREQMEDLQKELESVFIKLDSKSPEKDMEIKELYKNLYQKLESLKESLLLNSFSGRDEILLKIDNLQSHVRFINEINNHNTYVQIPVNMLNKNFTGELYILKRDSKRKKINPENTTMLIALNTENIGRIESLLTINKNNISLNLRVEDQNIINFLKENYKDLYNRINEKGYKLVDVKYRMIDHPVDVLNANEITEKELSSGKMSLDIRV